MCVRIEVRGTEGDGSRGPTDGRTGAKHIVNKGQRVIGRYGARLWRVFYAMFRSLNFISHSMFWGAIEEF